jgi:DNA/RNA endonuclease G (NUC1)
VITSIERTRVIDSINAQGIEGLHGTIHHTLEDFGEVNSCASNTRSLHESGVTPHACARGSSELVVDRYMNQWISACSHCQKNILGSAMFRSTRMMRVAVPCFGIGALAGVLGTYFITRSSDSPTEPHSTSLPVASATLSVHYPEGFPLPSNSKVLIRESFTTALNFRTRTPDWVAERLTADLLGQSVGTRSKADFKPDDDVPPIFRAQNGDYWNSGWSRGHLAASASHKQNQEAQDATFKLNSNIVPHDLSMNGCDWNRLEVLVRDLAKQYKTGAVYVVSGPAWVPDENAPYTQRPFSKNSVILHEVIGKTQVHVPTHMFKIIKVIDGAFHASAAFIMPNKPINDDRPLEDYQTQIEEVEKLTGLDLSGMTTSRDLCKATKCDRATNKRMIGWRHYGFIDQAETLKELMRTTRNAIDAGFVSEDNFLIPKLIRDRMRDLGMAGDILFPDEPSYQAAVEAGFKMFERRSTPDAAE